MAESPDKNNVLVGQYKLDHERWQERILYRADSESVVNLNLKFCSEDKWMCRLQRWHEVLPKKLICHLLEYWTNISWSAGWNCCCCYDRTAIGDFWATSTDRTVAMIKRISYRQQRKTSSLASTFFFNCKMKANLLNRNIPRRERNSTWMRNIPGTSAWRNNSFCSLLQMS